jgi:hypothetical protein
LVLFVKFFLFFFFQVPATPLVFGTFCVCLIGAVTFIPDYVVSNPVQLLQAYLRGTMSSAHALILFVISIVSTAGAIGLTLQLVPAHLDVQPPKVYVPSNLSLFLSLAFLCAQNNSPEFWYFYFLFCCCSLQISESNLEVLMAAELGNTLIMLIVIDFIVTFAPRHIWIGIPVSIVGIMVPTARFGIGMMNPAIVLGWHLFLGHHNPWTPESLVLFYGPFFAPVLLHLFESVQKKSLKKKAD